jgi:serine phosphatase RsbU (regulator of sigma subunit)
MQNIRSAAVRQRRGPGVSFTQPAVAGTYTAAIVLAIAILVSIAGSIFTDIQVRNAFVHHNRVDQTRSLLDELFRSQLDQETGLRGYLASGQSVYLEPYTSGIPEFERTWQSLRVASDRAGLQAGDTILLDLERTHDQWIESVAKPLIANPTGSDSITEQQVGKALIDQMRSDFSEAAGLYEANANESSDNVQALLLRATISTALLILLFGVAAIVADLFRSRTQAQLERERIVADILQRAFLSGWEKVPGLRIGTAYVSSTTEAAVGGDLFDIHRIDAHRSLVLVADVSGKGLEAAVETALVKYTLRALVEENAEPATLLVKFNRIFFHSLRDPSSFVSMFVGVFDDRDSTLRYASAGHGPTFLRRDEEVELLPVTGPIIGVTEEAAFSSVSVALRPGDMVVLATDGLTEARDSSGVAVEDEGVMRWVRDGENDPERLAAELVRRVARFSGGRINDDLALLILQLDRGVPVRGAQTTGDASAHPQPIGTGER